MNAKRDIRSTHRQLTRWLGEQSRSAEIDYAAHLVLNGLWACERNNPIPAVIFKALVCDVAAFERAVRK